MEAQQVGKALASILLVVDAFLQVAAKLGVERLEAVDLLRFGALGRVGEHALGLAFGGEFFEQRQSLADDLLLDEPRGRVLLQDLTRDVERQVFAVDYTTHEAQPFRHDLLRVVHDEDALDEQLDAALAAIDHVERSLLGDVEQAG